MVSQDERDKKIIQELIKSEIEWSNHEKRINKKNNIIKIINKNEKYKIKLIFQNKTNPIFDQYSSEVNSYFDLFNPPSNYINYTLLFENINIFIELQSLFAQFLIKKKGIPYSEKELNIELGQNSYPPHNNSNLEGFFTFFGALISFQFTMTSYFFCMG